MRKGYICLVVVAVLLITASVGAVVALLISASNPVVNTFTIGDINISLKETTGEKYTMTPGVKVAKDPTVTVWANSEKCWLFIKVEKENNFDAFCTYEIADGWNTLAGDPNVLYRLVEKSAADQAFPVLKNNCISIKDSLTEEQLNAVRVNPKLNFTAYAVQSDGVTSIEEAWRALNP
jgi:hypothetical protein